MLTGQQWDEARGRTTPEMKWHFYYVADALSLLPLISSPCHCHSPFIPKTLQQLNLIHSPIPIPIHHHHPWILLPKVTGETLVWISMDNIFG